MPAFVWFSAVRCQRSVLVLSSAMPAAVLIFGSTVPAFVLVLWQYGASVLLSVGRSAQNLISRVVFHRHISAESYQFMRWQYLSFRRRIGTGVV